MPREALDAALRSSGDTLPGGAGWALPLRLGSDGTFQEGRPRPLEDTARLVLELVPGERPLLPEFGCRLHSVTDLEGGDGRQLAAALIEEALERWVPELGVDRAEVVGLVEGKVRLRLHARGEWRSLEVSYRGATGEDSP